MDDDDDDNHNTNVKLICTSSCIVLFFLCVVYIISMTSNFVLHGGPQRDISGTKCLSVVMSLWRDHYHVYIVSVTHFILCLILDVRGSIIGKLMVYVSCHILILYMYLM